MSLAPLAKASPAAAVNPTAVIMVIAGESGREAFHYTCNGTGPARTYLRSRKEMRMDYKTYAVDDAPSGAKELLAAAKKNYGFVPNLLGTMAEAPSLLKGYMSLAGIFEESTLNPAERQ